MHVQRFINNPIISPRMDQRIGDNINGPSLIKVPDWIRNPLGKYYLYFAHHQGTYIRMAYADHLEGPWYMYHPGTLDLSDAFFSSHIASPDVHMLHGTREIRMYYHGCCMPNPPHQATRLAVSSDGLNFTAQSEILGSSYWRAFWWQGYWYTLEMPGTFRRSTSGTSDFDEGPCLFTRDMRHAAVHLDGITLTVFFSNAHDCPERILWASIQLNADWNSWQTSQSKTLLSAEKEYEGVGYPVEPSQRGAIHHAVHQLRDPCIFEENAKTYLLYSVAGEQGIAIGELRLDESTETHHVPKQKNSNRPSSTLGERAPHPQTN